MIVTGDLTVGGTATRIDFESENVKVADNVITLNSNLDDTIDPRLASNVVNGEDVDKNAGIEINRGKEGILPILKWIESSDTSTDETLKEGTVNVSIWNYEASTPGYELHQVIDAYTLGRQVQDKSGSKWVGYDGYTGTNYANGISNNDSKVSKYGFEIQANYLDNVVDSIVEEIDNIKFNLFNTVRTVKTDKGKTFEIEHDLDSLFVDITIYVKNSSGYERSVLPLTIVDENNIKIESSEEVELLVVIKSREGFEIDSSKVTVS